MPRTGKGKKYCVIGLGRFGRAVATTLYENGAEVIAIDSDPALVDMVQEKVTHAITFDATNEALLKEQGIENVDCAIVGIGEHFEANVLVTTMLKGLGVRHVITRGFTDIQRRILRSIGANQVVSPEIEIGRRLGKSLITGEIVDFLQLPEGFAARQVPAPKGVVGKSLAESKIKDKYRLEVIVIRRKGINKETSEVEERIVAIPEGKEVIQENDVLGVIGREADIERFV